MGKGGWRRASRMGPLGALVLASAAALLAPVPARACGPIGCGFYTRVVPPVGATGVPLNPEIRIAYLGGVHGHDPGGAPCELALSIRQLRLSTGAGDVVPLVLQPMDVMRTTRSWMRAVPDEPLLPNTNYVLERALGGPSASPCACEVGDDLRWSPISEFTTGDGLDTQPPILPMGAQLTEGEPVSSFSTCGSAHGYWIDPPDGAAEDDHPGVTYELLLDGKLFAPSIDLELPELFFNCAPLEAPAGSPVVPAGGRLQLRAVDLAGNVSAPGLVFMLDLDCAMVPPPALPGGEQDGQDSAGAMPGVAAACAAARIKAGSSPASWVWVLGALVGLRLASRRTARRALFIGV